MSSPQKIMEQGEVDERKVKNSNDQQIKVSHMNNIEKFQDYPHSGESSYNPSSSTTTTPATAIYRSKHFSVPLDQQEEEEKEEVEEDEEEEEDLSTLAQDTKYVGQLLDDSDNDNRQEQQIQNPQYYNQRIRSDNSIKHKERDSLSDLDEMEEKYEKKKATHDSMIEKDIRNKQVSNQKYNNMNRRANEEEIFRAQQKRKRRDSRESNSSLECIQSSSSYFPLTKKIQFDCRVPLVFSVCPFYDPERGIFIIIGMNGIILFHKKYMDLVRFGNKVTNKNPALDEEDIARCSGCQTIINPFCELFETVQKWKCNMCFNVMSFPRVYRDSQMIIRDVRAELNYGSYDILLPNRYRDRRDDELVYWFMIDVSPHAVKDGFLRNTCQAIKNALTDKAIQKNKQNIQVGVVGYDEELHFYNIGSGSRRPQIYVAQELEEEMEIGSEDMVQQLEEGQSEEKVNLLSRLAEKMSLKEVKKEKPGVQPRDQKLDYELPFSEDILVNLQESETQIMCLFDQIESMYEKQHCNEKRETFGSKFFKALEFSLDNVKFIGARVFVFHANPAVKPPKNKQHALYSITNKLQDTFVQLSVYYKTGSLQTDLIDFLYQLVRQGTADIHDVLSKDIISNHYARDLLVTLTEKYAWHSVLRFRCSKGWSVSSLFGSTPLRSNTYNLFNFNSNKLLIV